MIFVVAIVLAILAPIVSRLVQMAVSRQREFLADVSGVELTRNPYGLARALAKISLDTEPLEVANRATQHLYFENPIKARHRDVAVAVLHASSRHRPDQSPPGAVRPAAGGQRRGRAGRCAEGRLTPSVPGAGASPPRLPPLRTPWYPAARRRAPAGTRVRAEIAQLVEHATENRGVASSNLALGTNTWSVIERKWLSW